MPGKFPAPRRHRLAVLLVCLVAPVAAWPQAVQIATGGIWTASGDTTGPVKACGVKADVAGGTLLLYGRSDRPDTLRLTLRKTAWRIPNLTVPVTVSFAAGPDFQFVGKGTGATIRADVPAAEIRSFIHHFTADDDATLVLPNGHEPPWHLDLHGTTPTIEAMARCLEAAQIWLPPPFSQPPSATAPGADAAGTAPPVQPTPPSPREWVNPDTLPPGNP